MRGKVSDERHGVLRWFGRGGVRGFGPGLAAALCLVLLAHGHAETEHEPAGEAGPGALIAAGHARVERHIQSLVNPMVRQLRVARGWVRLGRVPLRDTDALQALFLPTLVELPRCVSMMVSDMTGYELMILRNFGGAVASPDGRTGPWLVRDFRREEWGAESRWRALDQQGRTTHTWRRREEWSTATLQWGAASGASVKDRTYDPRTRSWHRAARETDPDWQAEPNPSWDDNAVRWTDVDLFFTSRTPGITAGVASSDPEGRTVVIAYDLALRELSAFTRALRVTPSAQTLAFLDDGRVLGLPASASAELLDSATFVTLDDLDQPALAAGLALWQTRAGRARVSGAFEVDGQRHVADFVQVSLHPGRTLWLGTVLPVAEAAVPAAVQPWLLVALSVALALLLLSGIAWLRVRRRAAALSARPAQPAPRTEAPTAAGVQREAHLDRMRALGELAGGIAHDFNNVLLAITLGVEVIKDELARAKPDVDELRSKLDEMQIGATSAARMTRQLMDFGRQSSESAVVRDPRIEVETLARLLDRLLPAGIELEVDLGEPVGGVCLEAGQLEQVVMNLVINARDAMPAGGTVTLAVARMEAVPADSFGEPQRAASFVRIRVQDTGEGIAPELLDRIFEPYFTTKPEGHGTGLGLANVYAIVRRAGGSVRVHSQKRVGTTFDVYLPAHTLERSQGGQPLRSNLSESDTSALTVLLCDDEEVSRLLVREVLADAGFNVLSTDAPDAALAASERARQIDLVVCETACVDMTGARLLARLRERHPNARVIYLDSGATASRGGDDSVQHEASAAVVLAKPIDRGALLDAVEAMLSTARAPESASGRAG